MQPSISVTLATGLFQLLGSSSAALRTDPTGANPQVPEPPLPPAPPSGALDGSGLDQGWAEGEAGATLLSAGDTDKELSGLERVPRFSESGLAGETGKPISLGASDSV